MESTLFSSSGDIVINKVKKRAPRPMLPCLLLEKYVKVISEKIGFPTLWRLFDFRLGVSHDIIP